MAVVVTPAETIAIVTGWATIWAFWTVGLVALIERREDEKNESDIVKPTRISSRPSSIHHHQRRSFDGWAGRSDSHYFS